MKYRLKDWMPEMINKFKCQYHSKSSYDEAYDEVVSMRNPLPLPMDECSSQELFEELYNSHEWPRQNLSLEC